MDPFVVFSFGTKSLPHPPNPTLSTPSLGRETLLPHARIRERLQSPWDKLPSNDLAGDAGLHVGGFDG